MGSRGAGSTSTVSTTTPDWKLEEERKLAIAKDNLQYTKQIIEDYDEAVIDVFEQLDRRLDENGEVDIDQLYDSPIYPANYEMYSDYIFDDESDFNVGYFTLNFFDSMHGYYDDGDSYTNYEIIDKADGKTYIKKINKKLSPKKWLENGGWR